MTTNDSLLLREFNHRCANDLQMIINLLGLQSRRATSQETRQALIDATERIAIISRARTAFRDHRTQTLVTALEQVCAALHSYAEPLGILITLSANDRVHGLSDTQITILALIVNELATNAIKHAFETDETGQITIIVAQGNSALILTVDDDGLPFPELERWQEGGMGLDLVSQLSASIGAAILLPEAGSKRFEISLPMGS
jgi:two-component sensor histidine kinase